MTQFNKQKNWFIINCGCLRTELYIIDGNDKHNSLCFVLECIKQLQSNVLHSTNNTQFIDFMPMHFEPHSYFRNTFHWIKSIKHIVNILTSCDIPMFTTAMDSFCYYSTPLLSFNRNQALSRLKVLS